MTRALTRVAVVVAAAAATAVLPAAPASATVHEIVAQWCAGRGELAPPGVTGGSNADNFGRPVAASGVETGVAPFRDGFLITFDFDQPNAKVVGTGVFIVVGQINGMPLYLELIAPDPSFPAFQHCPNLTGG